MKLRAMWILGLVLSASLGCFATELRFYLRAEPATLDPLKVEDEFSELIRYLTGGVLVRVNRQTQQYQPELAESWKLSKDGRELTLGLRKNVRFSDGTAFDSADVLHTFRLLFAPELHSATADSFRPNGKLPAIRANGPFQVVMQFPQPMAGVERLLDQVAILSADARQGTRPVLGAYLVAEQKQGVSLLLRRNPNYWRRDEAGRALPRIDELRIGIQGNRELEALAFRRGEIDLISNIDARTYEDLEKAVPDQSIDIGPSLNQEFLWFNQVRTAKIPDHRRQWFRSQAFRRAVSFAINRPDLCRIAYRGHAIPSAGPLAPSNRQFFHKSLQPHPFDVAQSKRLLAAAGFRMDGATLRDQSGNAVTFTLLTNGGNRAREQMAALIQRDLRAIGIAMNIVTLDFPALLNRIGKTYEYEAVLLGLVVGDTDPNYQMNVWLSSGANHQWNPRQATPETPWEAEIDRLMQRQISASSEAERKTTFGRVQEILYEQEPFIYLVHPHALAAVSPNVKGVKPVVLQPQLLWNAETLEVVRKR